MSTLLSARAAVQDVHQRDRQQWALGPLRYRNSGSPLSPRRPGDCHADADDGVRAEPDLPRPVQIDALIHQLPVIGLVAEQFRLIRR
jgi:hypothetical protein